MTTGRNEWLAATNLLAVVLTADAVLAFCCATRCETRSNMLQTASPKCEFTATPPMAIKRKWSGITINCALVGGICVCATDLMWHSVTSHAMWTCVFDHSIVWWFCGLFRRWLVYSSSWWLFGHCEWKTPFRLDALKYSSIASVWVFSVIHGIYIYIYIYRSLFRGRSFHEMWVLPQKVVLTKFSTVNHCGRQCSDTTHTYG